MTRDSRPVSVHDRDPGAGRSPRGGGGGVWCRTHRATHRHGRRRGPLRRGRHRGSTGSGASRPSRSRGGPRHVCRTTRGFVAKVVPRPDSGGRHHRSARRCDLRPGGRGWRSGQAATGGRRRRSRSSPRRTSRSSGSRRSTRTPLSTPSRSATSRRPSRSTWRPAPTSTSTRLRKRRSCGSAWPRSTSTGQRAVPRRQPGRRAADLRAGHHGRRRGTRRSALRPTWSWARRGRGPPGHRGRRGSRRP